MRLIDADEFLKKLDHSPLIQDAMCKAFDHMPTIEAEPTRHGHWISASQTKFEKLFFPQRVFKCSVCGNYLDFDGVNAGRGSANFCPNCGATMDEVEDVEKTD